MALHAGGSTGARRRALRRLEAVARSLGPVAVVLVVQLWLFPMPTGVWLEGAILGLLGALMAVGLGLVYRLNRIVNFAQGDLGAAPSVLAIGLIGLSGFNYFLGLVIGLAAVLLLTAVVEIVVIRRFARAPRLVLTVVTIGLSQALIVLSLLIPEWIWGNQPLANANVAFPWNVSLSVSPVIFNANDLVAVIVAPLALIAVALWFRYSSVGIATRATGDRRDRAAMLGIPVSRLQTTTWIVAGVLSFLSVFLKAAILGLPLDPTFSLQALVAALAALALGGFTDLPVIGCAAVVIGVLVEGVNWNSPNNPTLVFAVLAAVVLGAVLVRYLGTQRVERETAVTWSLSAGVRDTPALLARLPEVRAATWGGGAMMLAFVATLPMWMSPGNLLELSSMIALALIGCSIVVLTGWTGQISLGQLSFAAVGATIGAVAMLDWHWDLSLTLLVGGAGAAVIAVIVGLPTLRLNGVFVAVTTLSVGLAASSYLLDRASFSWIPEGRLGEVRLFGAITISPTSEAAIYLLTLGVGVLALVALHGLRHSRTGRVLRAIGSNERAASSYGVSVARAKLGAFAISGFLAGVAGCLLVVVNQQYLESPYTVTVSLAVFTATAVGGFGSMAGAVMGATIIEGSTVFLPPNWQLFPSAAGVLIVLYAFPEGLAGLIYRGRDRLLSVVARRRNIVLDAPPPNDLGAGRTRAGATDEPASIGSSGGAANTGAVA